MNKKPGDNRGMRILFVAAEVTPLVKVGGLADVVGSLPKALTELGHDVRIMLPRYGAIDLSRYPLTPIYDNLKIQNGEQAEPTNLSLLTKKDGTRVFLVGNERYFSGKEVYGPNELEKFLFFSRAVFQALSLLDWQPEIIHCHDWHTALLPMWLKKSGYPYGTVLTIHNLAYQGPFDFAFLKKSRLEQYWAGFSPGAPEPPLNFLSQGILQADLVTTVSQTYAQEIMTPEYGEGLNQLLSYRQADLVGIVNGIDYEEYDPGTDPYLEANYSTMTIERRYINKLALQKRAGLPEDTTIPLIGMVQRLDEQKGFDILEKAVDALLQNTRTQLVILGTGRDRYENMLRQIVTRYPGQLALFLSFDSPLAHLIYAGSDMFLMPSRFEPCGLGQLIAMRYGAIPVVRHTGGLVDTVAELTDDLQTGTGFVFRDYSPEALETAVKKGVAAFSNKQAWQQTVQRVMKIDFSWKASAMKYEAAYRRVLEEPRHGK